jgi:hypothetical protein
MYQCAEYHYPSMMSIVMLSVGRVCALLSRISIIMLGAIMLSIVMVSAIRLNVVYPTVVAPCL